MDNQIWKKCGIYIQWAITQTWKTATKILKFWKWTHKDELCGSHTKWSQQQRKKITGDAPSRQNLKKKRNTEEVVYHTQRDSENRKTKNSKRKKKKHHKWIRRLILTYTQKALSVMGNPQGLSPSFLIPHLYRKICISNRCCTNTWCSPQGTLLEILQDFQGQNNP